MKIKTSELIGPALDWAVELANGTHWSSNGYFVFKNPDRFDPKPEYRYSTDPSQGHPIIEREGISVIRVDDDWGTDARGFSNGQRIPVWCAVMGQQGTTRSTDHQSHEEMFQIIETEVIYGPTALVAAMRCHVEFNLGKEVDIPEELL